MPKPNRLKVFLCHSSYDKPTVRELYYQLSAEAWMDIWLDEEKLFPGQIWQSEIEKAVEATDVVIVSLSKNLINKNGNSQIELNFVLDIARSKLEESIFIIPLRLEDCEIPRRLRQWHYADYFFEKERAYQRLLYSLRLRAVGLGIAAARSTTIYSEKSKTKRRSLPRPNGLNSNSQFAELEFTKVDSGPFIMGSKDTNELADENEKPQSLVDISYNYWISRFPVTNEQYAVFSKAIDNQHPVNNWEKKKNHPVVKVSWMDTQAYIEWLNHSYGESLPTGYVFRLPTEAEWEKAARGVEGNEWPWGNEFDMNKCNSKEGGTTPVGYFSPQGDSMFGCADMGGNIWEWTQSLMRPYPYNPKDGREDITTLGRRVLRGGSFDDNDWFMRSSCRSEAMTFSSVLSRGFRIVVAPLVP